MVYNWSTDITKFKNPKEKRIWELTQLIDYGLRGQKLSQKELKKYWPQVKTKIDPSNRRLYEFLLWGKKYSLPNKNVFWQKQPKAQKL